MADQEAPQDAPEAESDEPTPQAGKGKPQAGAPETISLDEAKKLRSEASGLRRRLKELEDADQQRKDSELSENQKLAKRLKELEDRNTQLESAARERLVREAVAEAGQAANAIYPGDLYDLIRAEIELSEEGKVRNARAAVQALKERRPALFHAPSGDGGAGRAGPLNTADMNRRIREAAGIPS